MSPFCSILWLALYFTPCYVISIQVINANISFYGGFYVFLSEHFLKTLFTNNIQVSSMLPLKSSAFCSLLANFIFVYILDALLRDARYWYLLRSYSGFRRRGLHRRLYRNFLFHPRSFKFCWYVLSLTYSRFFVNGIGQLLYFWVKHYWIRRFFVNWIEQLVYFWVKHYWILQLTQIIPICIPNIFVNQS